MRFTSRFDTFPVTGSAVEVRLRLRRVPEPVMPGGFDFSRKAYFAGLGAVGFSLSPAQQLNEAPKPPFDIRLRAKIDGLRHEIERRILEATPGERGAIVIALITGERGRIPEETVQALRNSGLAHMLAISGLHMALMAGSLFWLLRAGAAAFPALALQYPIKKWAAVLALLGGGFYLAISGGSIATQRAFLMMGIVFTAILLDRPALTLRNVAIAACVILALFPESLLEVSFQMSFAAVTALVAVYERTSKRDKPSAGNHSFWGRAARKAVWYVGGIALTTLVAGIAVAPFAAFHFHKLAQYSLIANLAAMPPFGLVVMPAALVALLTMPFGLEALPLQVMAWGHRPCGLGCQGSLKLAGSHGARGNDAGSIAYCPCHRRPVVVPVAKALAAGGPGNCQHRPCDGWKFAAARCAYWTRRQAACSAHGTQYPVSHGR